MQTFLPYPEFDRSAKVLDRARLGKQRVEVLQLVKGQWPNHPATKMWQNYREALIHYGLAICEEWQRRGYDDTVYMQLFRLAEDAWSTPVIPKWIGYPMFHASHRSNLLRKNPRHYGQFGWTEPDNLPYLWPSEWGYV